MSKYASGRSQYRRLDVIIVRRDEANIRTDIVDRFDRVPNRAEVLACIATHAALLVRVQLRSIIGGLAHRPRLLKPIFQRPHLVIDIAPSLAVDRREVLRVHRTVFVTEIIRNALHRATRRVHAMESRLALANNEAKIWIRVHDVLGAVDHDLWKPGLAVNRLDRHLIRAVNATRYNLLPCRVAEQITKVVEKVRALTKLAHKVVHPFFDDWGIPMMLAKAHDSDRRARRHSRRRGRASSEVHSRDHNELEPRCLRIVLK